MITAKDLRGVLAIMPTPAKPGADRLDATDTVDLDETARLVESLVRDGATGIMALGTMGECATTSQSDQSRRRSAALSRLRLAPRNRFNPSAADPDLVVDSRCLASTSRVKQTDNANSNVGGKL